MKSTTKRIHLDWNKLVGFNQVQSAKTTDERAALAIIGAKVGGKPPPAEAKPTFKL
jgi:hypothetical protein